MTTNPSRPLTAPFLAQPPIYDDIVSANKEMNITWVDWLNSITRITGLVITHDFLVDATAKTRQDAPILMAISYTLAQRNQLENKKDGSIIYVTDTTPPQIQFRMNGGWYTFTPVPA